MELFEQRLMTKFLKYTREILIVLLGKLDKTQRTTKYKTVWEKLQKASLESYSITISCAIDIPSPEL